MEQSRLTRIRQLIHYLETHQDRLTIDADTHPSAPENVEPDLWARYESSPNYYHGRPITTDDLLREMALAGVDMSLIWQNPAAIGYGEDREENFQKLLRANVHIRASADAHPQRFIPAGWTDPKALGREGALRLTDILMEELGFCFVKMNPAQNAFPIDSEDSVAVVDHIVAKGGVPTFHYGADTPYTPPEGLARIAQRHPEARIMAVHMGGGGAGYVEGEYHYQQTRALGLQFPNLFFPLSARRDTHGESDIITYQLAGPPFCHNLACASDAPYGRQSWNFGGYRLMLDSLIASEQHTDPRVRAHPQAFDQTMKQNLLGRNFARFVTEAYRRFLAARGF